MSPKPISATFMASGYMPQKLIPGLFVKAHSLTEKLEMGFHQLKRCVPAKSTARPKDLRWDILALTPDGSVQFQAGGIADQIPTRSLVATVGTFVRTSTDVIFNGDKSFIVLQRNRRFPRAIVTAQVYKWMLGGDYLGIYDSLTLPQLEEALRVMKAEGLRVPFPDRLAKRLKAATAASLQKRIVVAAAPAQRGG